jgi:hypothetical protein
MIAIIDILAKGLKIKEGALFMEIAYWLLSNTLKVMEKLLPPFTFPSLIYYIIIIIIILYYIILYTKN